MPEYAQLQTYVLCDKQSFPSVLRTYEEVLSRLGYVDEHVRTWLSHITYPSLQESYGGAILLAPCVVTTAQGGTLMCAGVEVDIFPLTEQEHREQSWVTLNMLFEAETIRESATSRYSVGVGTVLWSLLSECAHSFRENGTYFTDEAQDGQIGRFLTDGQGSFWSFDLARLPKTLSAHVQSVPALFAQADFGHESALARKDRWLTLPWQEAHNEPSEEE